MVSIQQKKSLLNLVFIILRYLYISFYICYILSKIKIYKYAEWRTICNFIRKLQKWFAKFWKRFAFWKSPIFSWNIENGYFASDIVHAETGLVLCVAKPKENFGQKVDILTPGRLWWQQNQRVKSQDSRFKLNYRKTFLFFNVTM